MLDFHCLDNGSGQWYLAIEMCPTKTVLRALPGLPLTDRVIRQIKAARTLQITLGSPKRTLSASSGGGFPLTGRTVGHIEVGHKSASSVTVKTVFDNKKIETSDIWNTMQLLRANEPADQRTMSNTYVVITGGHYAWLGSVVLANTPKDAVNFVLP